MSDEGYELAMAYRELDRRGDPSLNPCEWCESEVERLRDALREIRNYGGGDGGDWVECCNIAARALGEVV